MKKIFISEAKRIESFEDIFMIFKVLNKQESKATVIIGDNTGDLKAVIKNYKDDLDVGNVIKVEGINDRGCEIQGYEKISDFNIDDFLPTIERPVDEILDEIEQITKEEIKSDEGKKLNDYFFKNDEFIEQFKKGIGGLVQHHNYRGGLAEHTLNVMYLTKTLAYRYDTAYKEIAILAAKLHDIGKIEEYFTDGPFSVTMRGEMEGHIVIGITMLDEAFNAGGNIYSEEFKHRIRGCMVQHHGKVEYGSPKAANTPEAFIVNLADSVDALLNKIEKVRKITEPNTWSEYDRKIGARLYF